MPSFSTEITLGFSINWLHASLQLFPYMTPDAEAGLREHYFQMRFADKAAEFKALLKSADFNPAPTMTNGYLGGAEAHRLASVAVTKFNALGGKTQLGAPAEEPHCVTYYWINGQWIVIYNYEPGGLAGHDHMMTAGGTLHIVVRVTHTPTETAQAK